MSALPTLEERRDRKLALAIACLQDAFAHLEDTKPMVVANDIFYEQADAFSRNVSDILTGEDGLDRFAEIVKGRVL